MKKRMLFATLLLGLPICAAVIMRMPRDQNPQTRQQPSPLLEGVVGIGTPNGKLLTQLSARGYRTWESTESNLVMEGPRLSTSATDPLNISMRFDKQGNVVSANGSVQELRLPSGKTLKRGASAKDVLLILGKPDSFEKRVTRHEGGVESFSILHYPDLGLKITVGDGPSLWTEIQ